MNQLEEIRPDFLNQLQSFVTEELQLRPGKPGQKHIAQWAVEEIIRLREENENIWHEATLTELERCASVCDQLALYTGVDCAAILREQA